MIIEYICDSCGKRVYIDASTPYEDLCKIIKNKYTICMKCHNSK